jgi:hypothetical protein
MTQIILYDKILLSYSFHYESKQTFLRNINYRGRKEKKTLWLESASKLYRPSDRRLSAKLVPTFVDRGCHVVSAADPYGRNLDFLDQSHYFFFSSNSSVVLMKLSGPCSRPTSQNSGSTGNRTWTSECVARNSDH